MTKYINISFLLIVSLYAASCKKDSAVSSVPVIKFLDVNSTSIKEFKDSLVLRFEYTDADGDIGEDNPDKNDLFIKDRRLANADYYFVKPLSPPGSEIKIKGIISAANCKIKSYISYFLITASISNFKSPKKTS